MKTITFLLLIMALPVQAGEWEFTVDLSLGVPMKAERSYYGDAMVGIAEFNAAYLFHPNIGVFVGFDHVTKVDVDDCGTYDMNKYHFNCDGDNWAKAGLRFKW